MIKMSRDDLRRLVRAERERALASVDYRRGTPFGGKFGTLLQRGIVAQAIARYITQNGPIGVEGMTIGLSPMTSRRSSLKSTNTTRLNRMIRELCDSEMDGFAKEVLERWEEFKVSRGDFVPEGELTDGEKFSSQKFRGFT